MTTYPPDHEYAGLSRSECEDRPQVHVQADNSTHKPWQRAPRAFFLVERGVELRRWWLAFVPEWQGWLLWNGDHYDTRWTSLDTVELPPVYLSLDDFRKGRAVDFSDVVAAVAANAGAPAEAKSILDLDEMLVSPGVVKARLAVAVGANGEWSCCCGSANSEGEARESALETLEARECVVHLVAVDLPLPLAAVVKGKVVV